MDPFDHDPNRHDSAAAVEAGSALLDSFRSLGLDDLLERLSSVADGGGVDDLSAAVVTAAAATAADDARRRPQSPAVTTTAAPSAATAAPPPPRPPLLSFFPRRRCRGPAAAPLTTPPLYTPYKPTSLDRLRRALLGPQVQLAAQLAVGLSITALFTFLDDARFPGACVAATLFLVAAVQMAPMSHVGSRLGAAAAFLGALWGGVLLAGAVLSASRALAFAGAGAGGAGDGRVAPEPAHVIALSLLSAPLMLAFAAVRMAPQPPFMIGIGLSLALFFGLRVLGSSAATSHAAIWSAVLAQAATTLVAVGTSMFVTFLVLPSLASRAVEEAVSRALRAAGQSLSRTSARLFSPPEASAVAVAAALERKRSRDASKRGGQAFYLEQSKAQPEGGEGGLAGATAEFSDDGSGDDNSDDDDQEDEDEAGVSGALASATNGSRQSPDAWVVADGGSKVWSGSGGSLRHRHPGVQPAGLPQQPPILRPGARGEGARLSSFVDEARRLPPVPLPGSHGAIAIEREPDEVPGFHLWWDLVSAPVAEPLSARKQRRRREQALQARGEHRRQVAERAEALARAHHQQQQKEQQAQQQQQRERERGTKGGSAVASPFDAAAASPGADDGLDLEKQQQQQVGGDDDDEADAARRRRHDGRDGERQREAWERLAYREAVPGRLAPAPSLSSPSLQHLDLGAQGPPIAGLRPLLGAARMALGAAALEPAFLRGRSLRRFCPARWAALIGAIDSLVTRISALEAVAEDGGGLNEERQVWLAPMLAAKRRAFAEAAACLAVLSEAAASSKVRAPGAKPGAGSTGTGLCGAEQLFGRSWNECREELKAGLAMQVEAYVRAVREAVAEGAAAVAAAAAADGPRVKATARPTAAAAQPAAAEGPEGPKQHPRLVIYSAYNARLHFFSFIVTTSVLDAMQRVDDAARAALCPLRQAAEEEAASAAAAASGGALARPSRLLSPAPWLKSLVGMVLMLPVWAFFASLAPRVRDYLAPLFRRRRPAASSAAPAPSSGATAAAGAAAEDPPPAPPKRGPVLAPLPREAVAAFKYALATWLALAATLVALAASAEARRLAPVYGFVAVAISTSEKVEATASRVVSWILGSAAGGVAGYLIMMPPALAADGLGLALLLAALAFAVSLLGLTAFRTTIVLSLMTLNALVLCQYNDGCNLPLPPPPPGDPVRPCIPHGTAEVLAARVTAVAAGVLLSQAVTTLVAPWFTSDWALVTMARALRDSAAPFLEREFESFFEEGRRSAAAAAAAGPPPGRTTSGQDYAEAAEAAGAMARAAAEAARKAAGGGGVGEGEGAGAGSDKQQKQEQQQQQTLHPRGGGVANPNNDEDLAAAAIQRSVDAVRALQAGLAGPLVAVQLSLARDAAQWQRGVLATPPVVPAVLRSMLSLLDRLAAVEITLQAGAPITGRFTGVAFRHYFLPMEPAWRGVLAAVQELAAATAAHLVAAADRGRFLDGGGGAAASAAALERGARGSRCAVRLPSRDAVMRAIAGLHAARARARDAQVAARFAHVRAMIDAPSDRAAFAEFVAPDDTLRYLAFVTAHIKATNRFESVARAALRDTRCMDGGTSARWWHVLR